MNKLGKVIGQKRFLVLVIIVILVCLGLFIVPNIHFAPKSPLPPPGRSQVNSANFSPLIFGTNLDLVNANDQVLRSSATQKMLHYMHAQIIRMPVRLSLTEDVEIKAAQAIQATGATPLVVLQAINSQKDLPEDTRVVQDITALFGSTTTVYYEIGNEEDVQGISATTYSAIWNQLVPQLKKLAPNARFVGPVTYRYDTSYLALFLRHALPRPDAISWHEYTCDASWVQKSCLSSIDSWTQHITDARTLMTSTLGVKLPIMVTEWNYAANAMPNDGKNNNSAFMFNWTTKAITTLINNNVFASMQYSCTNTAASLISTDNTLTIQGNVLKTLYERFIRSKQIVVSAPSPSPSPSSLQTSSPTAKPSTPTSLPLTTATPTSQLPPNGGQPDTLPTPTPAPIPTVPPVISSNVLSFEDGGTDGWYGAGHVNQLFNSTTVAYNGSHALEVNLKSTGPFDYPYVGLNTLPSIPQPGQTLTGHIYVAGGSTAVAAKFFVLDSANGWHDPGVPVTLATNAWSAINFTIPAVNGHIAQIGVQFYCSPNNVNSIVYLDAISWG